MVCTSAEELARVSRGLEGEMDWRYRFAWQMCSVCSGEQRRLGRLGKQEPSGLVNFGAKGGQVEAVFLDKSSTFHGHPELVQYAC